MLRLPSEVLSNQYDSAAWDYLYANSADDTESWADLSNVFDGCAFE